MVTFTKGGHGNTIGLLHGEIDCIKSYKPLIVLIVYVCEHVVTKVDITVSYEKGALQWKVYYLIPGTVNG